MNTELDRRDFSKVCSASTFSALTCGLSETLVTLLGPNADGRTLSRPLGNIRDPEKARIAKWGAKTLEAANQIASRHAVLSIVSADDPPIFMSYGMHPTAKPPTDGKRIRGWLIHHVNLGIALKEKTDDLKLEAHLKYPGAKTETNPRSSSSWISF